MVSQASVGQSVRQLLKKCNEIEDPTGNITRLMINKMKLDNEPNNTGRLDEMILKTLLRSERAGKIEITRSEDGVIRKIRNVVNANSEPVEINIAKAVNEVFQGHPDITDMMSTPTNKKEGTVQTHDQPAVMFDQSVTDHADEAPSDIRVLSNEDIILRLTAIIEGLETERDTAQAEKADAEAMTSEAIDKTNAANTARDSALEAQRQAEDALRESNEALTLATGRIAELSEENRKLRAVHENRDALAANVAAVLARNGAKVSPN